MRPKHSISYLVSMHFDDVRAGKDPLWWAPARRQWVTLDETHIRLSTYAGCDTKKQAWKIAEKLNRAGATKVEVVMRTRRRKRRFPTGYEKVWVFDFPPP